MAALAKQIITEEIEKVSTQNSVDETFNKTVPEALVALPSKNVDADRGTVTSTNNSDKNKENYSGNNSSQSVSLSGKSLVDENINQSSQEQNKLSLDSKCSQESRTSTTKSSCSNVSNRSESASSKYTNENSNSSHSSTVKESQNIDDKDEDSRSSISSTTSTAKTSHHTTYKLDDESNSRSSFKPSSKRSSPEKQSDNESTSKVSQSIHTEDADSRSSIVSSNSRSTNKNSQSVIDKSDDESNTRSSFQLDSKNSSPEKLSDNEKNTPKKEDDNKKSRSKKYFNIIDSESEDETIFSQKSAVTKEQIKSDSDESRSSTSTKFKKRQKIKKIKKLIDSDSDEESVKNVKSTRKKRSDSEASDNESEKSESIPVNKSNKISNIVDSDSDSESGSDNGSQRGGYASPGEENESEKSKEERKKPEKKRTGSARASKDAAMQQIHSETQRLIREAEISLPYHMPKQRTLQEFLNRKKITSDIPSNLTYAEKVKMFPDVISKVIKEKEEEAEIFYKSSDSEEEKDELMEMDKCENENGNKIDISTTNNLADTQKLTQDHIQDSHNKITILQQRSLDFGVPRKLFLEESNDKEQAENISEEHNSAEKSINTDIAVLEKKSREVKSGIREASIPRKLFTDENAQINMDVDINNDENNLEEKIEDTLNVPRNTDKNNEKNDNTSPDISNEDIVLNFSETELDINDEKKALDTSKINNLTEKSINQENIMISETPFISNKEIAKINDEKRALDTSNINNLTEKSIDQKNMMISETPLISNKEITKSLTASQVQPNKQTLTDDTIHESDNTKHKDDDDLVLKLAPETKEDEIIDNNVLRADFFLAPDFDEPAKKPTIKETIIANAMKNKPMIKASPGSIIDFTSSAQMKEGVTLLLDRFARHSAVYKPNVNEISEIKTIRTEGIGNDITVIEEILPFTKTIMEDDGKKESKPGEKLKKLKEDLKRKIATARNEEWKRKEEDEKEEEEEESKCKGDDFYEGLPDEEELLEDEVSTESEPEENDIPMKESRRPKCAFGDEEAEVSEDENAVDIDNENDEDEEDEEEEEQNEDNEEEDEEKEESRKEEISNKPRILKRIIRPLDEDSNESKSSLSNDANLKLFSGGKRIRNKTDEDMFDSQTSSNGYDDLEADSIPPFQSRNRCGSDSRSQACKTPLPKPNNILSMISPVTQLTALNTSLDSAKKSASKTPNNFNFGQINASMENTPTDNSVNRPQTNCNMEKMINLQKKLFEDPPETVNDDELLEICSGSFTNTRNSEMPVNGAQNEVTDSQLMELCSGTFPTQTVDMKKMESGEVNSFGPEISDETSQDITLTLDDDENSKSSPTGTVSSVKRSDESMFSSDSKSPVKLSAAFGSTNIKNPMEAWLQTANKKSATTETQPKSDMVTDSQLLDLCSGAFTSQPVDLKELEKNDIPQINDKTSQNFGLILDDNTKSPFKQALQSQKPQETVVPKQKINALEDDSNAPRKMFTIVSSSDDEDGELKKERPKKKVLKKKKVQKLALSDEEEDEDKEFSDEEESEIEEEEDNEQFVDYDSEENEVVVVPKKEIKKVAAKFLENEAELSESDWDSADEDEQGMDKLEFEEADAEEIDEDKMKEQLDRVHMKQVMDEDQREVKMLQELLFDDGDLHNEGAGRERKFKWKNIDNLGDLDLNPRTDDDGAIDDEVDAELEVQIRKTRYEQQKFLEETEKSLDVAIDEDFSESQLFNKGLKIVSVRSTIKTSTEEQKLIKSNSVCGNRNLLMVNSITNVTKKTLTNTKSLSFSNMKGSFLSRGDATLVRIAQNLPEKGKMTMNNGRKGNFVFQHLSPSVSNAPKEDSEQENDNTPAKDKNKRKRKMFASQGSSQTPRSSKKLKVDDRTTGKKLF